MNPAPINPQETARLRAVQRYLHFTENRQNDLQQIVMLASVICGSPIAMITLMDKDVQFVKIKLGLEVDILPRSTSFCTHAIEQESVMVVSDASVDERFANAPAVVNDPHIRFYAGANLKTYDGYNVGTLCVYDKSPKELSQEQVECLDALANQVSHIMELDRNINQLKSTNETLSEIARIQSHEIRQPVASIIGILELMKAEKPDQHSDFLNIMESSVQQLDERIRMIVNHTNKDFE